MAGLNKMELAPVLSVLIDPELLLRLPFIANGFVVPCLSVAGFLPWFLTVEGICSTEVPTFLVWLYKSTTQQVWTVCLSLCRSCDIAI